MSAKTQNYHIGGLPLFTLFCVGQMKKRESTAVRHPVQYLQIG